MLSLKQLEILDRGLPGLSDGIFGVDVPMSDAELVIIPVPWEATTSYRKGTARGPEAVLQASAQLDMFDLSFGKPFKRGITMLPIDDQLLEWNRLARAAAEIVIEGWETGKDPELFSASLAAVNHHSKLVDKWVYEHSKRLIQQNKLVAVLGGDHSCPFGLIRALAEQHPRFGVLHVDAHYDLREAYEGFERSHASIMYNVVTEIPQVSHVAAVGIRDFCVDEFEFAKANSSRHSTFFDRDWAHRKSKGELLDQIVQDVVNRLPDNVYISFDIDGLDPVNCPNTGTPVPGGLSYNDAMELIEKLAMSGRKIIGFDLCEVAPSANEADEWDGNVGARVLYRLCGASFYSRVGRIE
jgi:agmatinase